MLLSLANWLQTLSPEFGFFRVFQYLTFRAVMAAMTSMLILLAAVDEGLGGWFFGITHGERALLNFPFLRAL